MISSLSRLGVCVTLVLAACATRVHDIPSSYVLTGDSESVVIGRLIAELTGPGGLKPLAFFEKLTHMHLTIRNEATDESYEIVCDESGMNARFYVALPAGRYSLAKATINQLESSPRGGFSVSGGEAVYIGTLRFRNGGFGVSVAASVATGATTFLGDWAVEDHEAEAVADFRQKFPQFESPVRKSLIDLGS